MDSSGTRRVLIADDNADAGDTLGQFIEALGLSAVVVRDGQAAVDAAAACMPDIAILDLGMPGLDGWQACERIRQLPGGSSARVIALTGWGQAHDQERARAAGFDHHCTKPVDLGQLLALVDGAA